MTDGARNSWAYRLGAGLPVTRREAGAAAVLGFKGAAAASSDASAQVSALLAGQPKIALEHEPGTDITLEQARAYAIGRVVVLGAPDFDDWELPTIPGRLGRGLDAVHFVCSEIPSARVRALVHDRATGDFTLEQSSPGFEIDRAIYRTAEGLPVTRSGAAFYHPGLGARKLHP